MAEADRTLEQRAYNDAAMRTAQALDQARQKTKKKLAGIQIPRERLFPSFDRAGLGVVLEYERMGNQPVSDALQARADQLGCEFEHLGLSIGSVIHNIDLKKTDSPEQTRFIRDVLLERKVVFFRDQHLGEDEQVAFGRQFGDLDAFPFGPSGGNPFILEIRHGRNSPGLENGWHTDVTWMERPSLGSIAQLIEGPAEGGDTLFSDSHACYLGLPKELQKRIEHLHGVNDYRTFLTARGPQNLSEELVETIKMEIPFGVSHPILRTHPETGKTALYIHGGFLRHDSLYDGVTGEKLDPKESQAIVRELQAQHSRPEYTCRFKWTPGSIAFWDNRAVQHYAASDYHPHKRILRRVTVSGDKPFYDPST
jgi:taurine dioxygenase